MTPERWKKLKSAFATALEAGGPHPDLLADDPELRSELLALFEENAAAGNLFENPDWRDERLARASVMDGIVDETEPSLSPGTRIGDYAILSFINRGGMGEVYRAEQTNPRREVAIKIIQHGLYTRRAAQRLVSEASILARLHHPGIASVIEAGVMPADAGGHESRPYFSMELVQGDQITRHADAQGLTIDQRIDLMRRVCEAVAHAHQRGVIHRDLKPANILVDQSGQPKVLDFGIARLIDREPGQTLTRPGWVPGTIPYMSPEQASGDADSVDTRSDVYSLGVVLYELLTERLPISPKGKSQIEMLRSVCTDDPPRAGLVRKALRGDCETILATALNKDPTRRYQSAAAFGDDLARLLRHEPIIARPASIGYVLRVFARRRWRELTLMGLALAAGLGLAGWQFQRAVQAEKLAQHRLDDTRHAASELVTSLYERLWSFSSTAEVREFLAGEATRRLDQVVTASGDDPAALWDFSTAIYKLGQSTGHPGQPNTGHREASIQLVQKALEIRERVLAMDPSNKDYRLGTAATSVSMAILTEAWPEKSRLMDRAMELFEGVTRDFPSDSAAAKAYAYNLAAYGAMMASNGDLRHAVFERSRQVCERLVAAEPDNNTWLGTLGTVMSIHAGATRAADLQKAVELYEQARAVLARASAREPNEYSYVRHIGRADRVRAQHLAAQGQWAEAISLGDATVTMQRAWLARDPYSSVYRLDLVDAMLLAADIRLDAGGDTATTVPGLIEEARILAINGLPPDRIAPEVQDRLKYAADLADRAALHTPNR
ncbi:MAG: protein kinase [Planctomycetes bacterium]|nr:protein kinase [Planctomycetota bacterium]